MASPLDMPKISGVRKSTGSWPAPVLREEPAVPIKTFHGTPVDIKGDRILPATVHGGKSHWGDTGVEHGQPSERNTFSHPDELEAWHWGNKVVKGTLEARDPGYRNRVYEVTPGDNARHGREVPGEVVASHHTITGRHDIMPGRQGTFPDLNWNQFKGKDHDEYDTVDVNHPTDAEVKYGHGMVSSDWTMDQADRMTQRFAKNDMASDLQWDRGDRVTRESRRDRRFGEQGTLFH